MHLYSISMLNPNDAIDITKLAKVIAMKQLFEFGELVFYLNIRLKYYNVHRVHKSEGNGIHT